MKVIALISGGKDSLFSILHCTANGHDVVALANLYPASDAHGQEISQHGNSKFTIAEDVDSHMYQTVGYQVVALYHEVLGLPLYRQQIIGDAFQKDQEYDFDSMKQPGQDETESLTTLLSAVKSAHPDVDAVSTGAILSTYQRSRVESVAIRLGLVPLSFLWQYPCLPPAGHSTLLRDMAAVDVDARIIKVASGGLDQRHLWQNVADSKTVTQLERDMGRFGELEVGAVLGEGGEYETLALDGPPPLWKKRIEIDVKDDSFSVGESGVALARLGHAALKDKAFQKELHPRLPDFLDEQWSTVLDQCGHRRLQVASNIQEEASLQAITQDIRQEHVYETLQCVHLVNVSAQSCEGIDDQTREVCSRMATLLLRFSLSPDDLAFVTILLRSMQDFSMLNATYKHMFKKPTPPARVTISCGEKLPQGINIMLSAVAYKGPRHHRQGLHVQSQSYWAPANIGPYSQAVSLPLSVPEEFPHESRLVYVSGQIPLVPASMQMVDGQFKMHAVLALQHLWRVGRAMKVQWWISGLAFIVASTADEVRERAAEAIEAWKLATKRPTETGDDEEEDQNFDVGDAMLRTPWMQPIPTKAKSILSPLPDWSRVSNSVPDTCSAPAYAVQVAELPRGATVEWSAIGLDFGIGRRGVSTLQNKSEYVLSDTASGACWSFHTAKDLHDINEALKAAEERLKTGSVELLEAYVKMPLSPPLDHWLRAHRAQITPCHRLWDETGEISLLMRCHYYIIKASAS
ncbi:MAG: hypothetical protein Q9162_000727 [Coniocarpon cinnabarinum]